MNAERYLLLLAGKLRMLADMTYDRRILDLRLEELAEDIDFFLESDVAGEEQRRDEKRGTYPQYEGVAN